MEPSNRDRVTYDDLGSSFTGGDTAVYAWVGSTTTVHHHGGNDDPATTTGRTITLQRDGQSSFSGSFVLDLGGYESDTNNGANYRFSW